MVDLSASNASGGELFHVVVSVGSLDSHDVVSLKEERDTLHVWNLVDIGLGLELVHASVSAWLEDHSGSSLLKTNSGLLVHVGPALLSPVLEGSLWLNGLLDGVDVNNLEFDAIGGLIEIDGPAEEAESGSESEVTEHDGGGCLQACVSFLHLNVIFFKIIYNSSFRSPI